MEEKYLAAKYILFSEANVNLGGYLFFVIIEDGLVAV
jgi:hypothetical protein